MRCSVAVVPVGQASSLASKAYDMEAAHASRLSQSPSDQG